MASCVGAYWDVPAAAFITNILLRNDSATQSLYMLFPPTLAETGTANASIARVCVEGELAVLDEYGERFTYELMMRRSKYSCCTRSEL